MKQILTSKQAYGFYLLLIMSLFVDAKYKYDNRPQEVEVEKVDTFNIQLPLTVYKPTAEESEVYAGRFEEEDNSNLMLRVYVTGGGCSGFQYGFDFDENENEGDVKVENGGVTLLIDPMSFQYLAGASVDYIDDLQGARFVISNPNATTTCGCGSSFSV